MMLVGLKIPNKLNLVQNRNFVIRIGNGIILICQCRFHHINHLYQCQTDLFTACLIFYLSCSYDSNMLFLPRYFCSDYITTKGLAVNQSPSTNNEHFDHKTRYIQKKKHKVMNQVSRVKNEGRFSKNPNLTHD